MIKLLVKPKDQARFFTWLGAISQIAFALAILLGRVSNPVLDFWAGALLGFSLVGNLAYLYNVRRKKHGGHDD